MKEQTKYIIVGRFKRDTNGVPSFCLSNEDSNYIDMDKDYIITVSGPINNVQHKQIKNNSKTKSIIRCFPEGVTLFS